VPFLLLRFTLLLIAIGLWLSPHAIAFTLRRAPIPTTEPSSHLPARGLADLPTPQFFRFIIAPDGITLTLEPIRPLAAEATPRLQKTGLPEASPAVSPASQSHPSPLSRRLSGVEMLLLQQTQIVGDRQQD
jgi:hypothetical protein